MPDKRQTLGLSTTQLWYTSGGPGKLVWCCPDFLNHDHPRDPVIACTHSAALARYMARYLKSGQHFDLHMRRLNQILGPW